MAFPTVKAVAELTRVDTAILVFAGVFIPVAIQTEDLVHAAKQALPLFTATGCTFILNDVADAERDEINHPNRPIPSRRLSVSFAIALYLSLLTLSVVLVKVLIELRNVFIYTTFIIALINYDHVVSCFPKLKNFYVSATTVLPVLILSAVSQEDRPYELVSAVLVLFVFARELLMDDLDRAGDTGTLAKMVSSAFVFRLSIAIQLVAVANFYWAISQTVHWAVYAVALLITGISFALWKLSKKRLSLFVMKLNIFVGIAYLI